MARPIIDVIPPHKPKPDLPQEGVRLPPSFIPEEPVTPRQIFIPLTPPRRSINLSKTFKVTSLCLLFGVGSIIVFYMATVINFRSLVLKSSSFIFTLFENAKVELSAFKIREAKTSFKSIQEEVEYMQSKAKQTGLFAIADWSGIAAPNFKDIPQTFQILNELSKSAVLVTEDLEALRTNAFSWIMDNGGVLLLGRLRHISEEVEKSSAQVAALQAISDTGLSFDTFLPSLQEKLQKTQTFLSELIKWLETPYEQHFAVFFQNPSEIRPGGGFIGSYADITFKAGSITNIDVRDIYDPDGQLDELVIPPKPLQGLTTRWGARDANWFFDFPTSAKKVISFLERSKIYSERTVTFDGALALNTTVIESILKTIGPIPLPDYNLTITNENFLEEIQKEVETGTNKSLGKPKQILKDLTPLFFKRLGLLGEEERLELFKALQAETQRKNIMVYFKNPILEGYAQTSGAGGEVYVLPDNFIGDYLAVVNANVAGGKTDIFIKESLSLQSVIKEDGTVENTLTVERDHTGDNRKEYWYTATNKNYMKVFTPQGSILKDVTGGMLRTITSSANYAQSRYAKDHDLSIVEETKKLLTGGQAEIFDEGDKTVFGTWVQIPSGTKKTVSFRYTHPDKLAMTDIIPYQFAFERQSGTNPILSIAVTAPPHYRFRETGQTTFTYRFEDPPARIFFDLGLERIK